MVNDKMTVLEATININKWLNECKTTREKSMLLNFINQIAISNMIWAMKKYETMEKTDGDELSNLIKIMRSFSIYATQLDDITDPRVLEIYDTFDKLHKSCLHNYYAKRKI